MATPSVLARPVAPDSVSVILGVRREVKINNVRNPVDVDSAGRDVGGDQNPNFSIAKSCKARARWFLTRLE